MIKLATRTGIGFFKQPGVASFLHEKAQNGSR